MTETTKEVTYKRGKLYSLPLNDIRPDPSQPRKHIDDSELQELKQSIEVHGVLSPIIFRQGEDKNLILVAGERRFRACQALGKAHINGIYLDTEKYDEVALVDNIQRVDLHAVDEAEAVYNLKTKYGYTQEQLGNMVGKAQNTVSEILALMGLSEDIREDARNRKELSRGALLKVARIKRETAQKKAYNALVAALSTGKKEIKRPRLDQAKKITSASDTALKCIKNMNPNLLGDDKEVVMIKLQELLNEIQNKLEAIVT